MEIDDMRGVTFEPPPPRMCWGNKNPPKSRYRRGLSENFFKQKFFEIIFRDSQKISEQSNRPLYPSVFKNSVVRSDPTSPRVVSATSLKMYICFFIKEKLRPYSYNYNHKFDK